MQMADVRLQQGDLLASVCSGCHGGPDQILISLEGYTADQIEASLSFYASDTDGDSVMHRLARGYTAEQITLISQSLGTSLAQEAE